MQSLLLWESNEYYITWVCVLVALRIQHAMRYKIICELPHSTIFFHISSWMARFSKKIKLPNIKCVFWFSLQLLSEKFLILRKNEREMIKTTYTGLQGNFPLFLSNFNENWIFLTDFRKILKYQISWKSAKSEPKHADGRRMDGQTDRHDEANNSSSQFRERAYEQDMSWRIYCVQRSMWWCLSRHVQEHLTADKK